MNNDTLLIINIISNYIIIGVFLTSIIYSLKIQKKLDSKIIKKNTQITVFQQEYNDTMLNLQKEILKYKVLSKNYWELFAKEFNKKDVITLTELQHKLEMHIMNEEYEIASTIQDKIDKLINNK